MTFRLWRVLNLFPSWKSSALVASSVAYVGTKKVWGHISSARVKDRDAVGLAVAEAN